MSQFTRKYEKRVLLILVAFILLFFGLSLYLHFVETAYISIFCYSLIHVKRINLSEDLLSALVSGYAADLLWSIALVLVIQAILWLRREKIWMLSLCSLLGIAYELMQFWGIANGTADIVDLTVYCIGSILGIIIILGGNLYEKK